MVEPNTEDWLKLKKVLGWIKGTIDDKLIIEAESLSEAYTRIDTSYAIHAGQTGGAMSLDCGIIHGIPTKEKLNLKSLTVTELIGVSDYVG